MRASGEASDLRGCRTKKLKARQRTEPPACGRFTAMILRPGCARVDFCKPTYDFAGWVLVRFRLAARPRGRHDGSATFLGERHFAVPSTARFGRRHRSGSSPFEHRPWLPRSSSTEYRSLIQSLEGVDDADSNSDLDRWGSRATAYVRVTRCHSHSLAHHSWLPGRHTVRATWTFNCASHRGRSFRS